MARWAKTTLCSPEEVITRWPLAGQVNWFVDIDPVNFD